MAGHITWAVPGEFPGLNCTACKEAIFSLDNYREHDIYPIQHVINPFQVYLLTQHIWFSVVMITLWESYEVLTYAICAKMDCPREWNVQDLSCAGYSTDNLLGDVGQGLLGIFLAIYFCTALAIPKWSLNLRDSMRLNVTDYWWKRVLFYIALFATCTIHTLTPKHGFNWTVLVWAGLMGVVILIFFFWNKTKGERELFWTDQSTGKFAETYYNRLYIGWFLIITLLAVSFYFPFHSTYLRVEPTLPLIWLVLTIYGSVAGRGDQLLDLMTFGLASILSENESARFLGSKMRYLKLKNE
jgi:lysylphosphatidylglycerol synthetase-like protein (DUF2156 family)